MISNQETEADFYDFVRTELKELVKKKYDFDQRFVLYTYKKTLLLK